MQHHLEEEQRSILEIHDAKLESFRVDLITNRVLHDAIVDVLADDLQYLTTVSGNYL